MKKLGIKFMLPLALAMIISLIFVTNSCKKDSSGEDVVKIDSVKTDNPNGLQSVITIPSGTITSGNLPPASTSGNIPQITNYQSSAAISSGYQLLLPFQYTSSTGWKYIYLQISGATNGYFVITNPGSSGTSGTIVVPINIPAIVLNGYFDIKLSVVDANGLISTYKTIEIVIKGALTCSNASNSGSEGLTFSQVDLGTKAGLVSLSYDTYSIPDRVDVFQGTSWLGGTGTNPGTIIPPLCNCSSPLPGFIGKSGKIDFNFNPSNGRIITVVVSGCLGSGTAWQWYLSCPQ